MSTEKSYLQVIEKCKQIFVVKNKDYGQSWRDMRLPSLTDQISIKLNRIRTIQDTGENKVGDSIESEFMAIINYAAMAIFIGQNWHNSYDLQHAYHLSISKAKEVMEKKNHDYGESWRTMRISSITDLMIAKIHRLKQIEDNNGKTIISEGAESNYIDILNYAVFCLILMEEKDVTHNSILEAFKFFVERDKRFFKKRNPIFYNGKEYTSEDLINELEGRTELGSQIEQAIITIAIESFIKDKIKKP